MTRTDEARERGYHLGLVVGLFIGVAVSHYSRSSSPPLWFWALWLPVIWLALRVMVPVRDHIAGKIAGLLPPEP